MFIILPGRWASEGKKYPGVAHFEYERTHTFGTRAKLHPTWLICRYSLPQRMQSVSPPDRMPRSIPRYRRGYRDDRETHWEGGGGRASALQVIIVAQE